MAYGRYSQKAVDMGSGTSIYSSVSGVPVEVTCVTSSLDSSFYRWDDKVFVGEVKSYLKCGKKPRTPLAVVSPRMLSEILK